jgi:hypothetical protein
MDARSQGEVSIARRSGVCVSNWAGCADFGGLASTAINHTTDRGNAITLVGYRKSGRGEEGKRGQPELRKLI